MTELTGSNDRPGPPVDVEMATPAEIPNGQDGAKATPSGLETDGLDNLESAVPLESSAATDATTQTLQTDGLDTLGSADQMNEQDLHAIKDYTGDGYKEMNTALRAGEVQPGSQLDQRIGSVSAAIDKAPTYQGTVTRGTDLDDDSLARYQPGATVKEPAFTSATADPSKTFEGNTIMNIDSVNGRDISDKAVFDESEVIFDKDTEFEVIDNYYDEELGKNVITLMEK